MSDFLTVSVLVATLASGIRLAAPLLLAGLGETVGQRSGVLNLGVEGVMLVGAFGAYYGELQTGSTLLAALVGLGVGAVMGAIYAFVTVVMHAEQGISGIGIYLFGLGFTDVLFRSLVGTVQPIDGVGGVPVPGLSAVPVLGELLFDHSVLAYLAFALVPATSLLINRTTFGLNVRAVGETPEAADTLGVSVGATRVIAILIGNTLAGLAGATLALELGVFQLNVTAGQGFIAIALVYFGAWRPTGVMAGALLFGVVSATVLQWKTLGVVSGPTASLITMAPAVLTIVVLVLVSRRIGTPAALTQPFDRTA